VWVRSCETFSAVTMKTGEQVEVRFDFFARWTSWKLQVLCRIAYLCTYQSNSQIRKVCWSTTLSRMQHNNTRQYVTVNDHESFVRVHYTIHLACTNFTFQKHIKLVTHATYLLGSGSTITVLLWQHNWMPNGYLHSVNKLLTISNEHVFICYMKLIAGD